MFGFTWSDGTAPRFRLTTIRSRPERRLPRRHAPRAASRRRQGGGRQMLTRRSFFILGGPVALAAALFGPAGLRGALAHHGWRWAEDGNFELTGIIETVQLANPHGVLTVDAGGEGWAAHAAPPCAHEQASLAAEMLTGGRGGQ